MAQSKSSACRIALEREAGRDPYEKYSRCTQGGDAWKPGPSVSQHGFLSNIMTLGWYSMLQFSPARKGCCMWKGNENRKLIDRSGEGVINVPSTGVPQSNKSPFNFFIRCKYLTFNDKNIFCCLRPSVGTSECYAFEFIG